MPNNYYVGLQTNVNREFVWVCKAFNLKLEMKKGCVFENSSIIDAQLANDCILNAIRKLAHMTTNVAEVLKS